MEKNLNLFANVTFDASNWKSNSNPSCLQQVNEKSKSLSKFQKKALMIIFNPILENVKKELYLCTGYNILEL